MQTAILVILAVGSICLLGAFFIYVYLAWTGRSELVVLTYDGDSLTFTERWFSGIATIGVLAVVYGGIRALLWWVPADLDLVDPQYADTEISRTLLAITPGLAASMCIWRIFSRYVSNTLSLRAADKRVEALARILFFADNASKLKSERKMHQDELDRILAAKNAIDDQDPDHFQLREDALRDIIEKIDFRLAELSQRE